MRLVVAAHGTRQLLGNAVASIIAKRAGRVLAMESRAAYVELCEPLLTDVLADRQPSVVVPLLLSTGYHIKVDLPQAAEGLRWTMGRALGPDPLLASAQVSRLVAAGVVPGQPVVLVAAGSTTRRPAPTSPRPAGCWRRRGAVRSGSPPSPAPAPPALDEVVRPATPSPPYLLAPGFFSDMVRARAEAAGAEIVADVIGPHPDVVELVVRRAAALLARGSSGQAQVRVGPSARQSGSPMKAVQPASPGISCIRSGAYASETRPSIRAATGTRRPPRCRSRRGHRDVPAAYGGADPAPRRGGSPGARGRPAPRSVRVGDR